MKNIKRFLVIFLLAWPIILYVILLMLDSDLTHSFGGTGGYAIGFPSPSTLATMNFVYYFQLCVIALGLAVRPLVKKFGKKPLKILIVLLCGFFVFMYGGGFNGGFADMIHFAFGNEWIAMIVFNLFRFVTILFALSALALGYNFKAKMLFIAAWLCSFAFWIFNLFVGTWRIDGLADEGLLVLSILLAAMLTTKGFSLAKANAIPVSKQNS